MADGMGPGTAKVEIVRVRQAGGFAYPYAALGERTSPFLGNINVAAKRERFALAPVRVGRFGFTAARTTDTVDYLTVNQGSINLFNVGSGGAYTLINGGMTGTATDAESMAGAQGAIVRDGATFVGVGLEIRRESAWYTTAANAADQLGNRDYPAWISDNGPSGFNYPDAVRELIEPAAFFKFTLTQNVQVVENRNGSLSDWMARGSKISTFGNFIALTNEYGSGGQRTSSQIQATITLGGDPARVLRVEERLGLDLPATGSVVLEYGMYLWGYTICGDPPGDDVCAVPGMADAGAMGQVLRQIEQIQQLLTAGRINRMQFDAMMAAVTAAVPQLPGT